MKGQFVIVNKETGAILMHGQSVYAYYSGANKGLAYWVKDKVRREQYVIIELNPVLMKSMASNVKLEVPSSR